MSARKRLVIASLVLGLFASLGGLVFALASGLPSEDASVYSMNPGLTQNADKLRVEAGTPNCAASRTRWSYLKWNLADIPAGQVIGSAAMTLTVDLVNLGVAPPGGPQVTLYQVIDDSWSESSVTAANGSAMGTLIQSIAVPPTAPATITFDDASLTNYLQQQADGDNVASFGLALTGNCGEGTVLVRMYSKDQTVVGNYAFRPYLMITNPNAVTLTTFRSSDPALNWPLAAGVIALMGLAVAGGVLLRRRVA